MFQKVLQNVFHMCSRKCSKKGDEYSVLKCVHNVFRDLQCTVKINCFSVKKNNLNENKIAIMFNCCLLG